MWSGTREGIYYIAIKENELPDNRHEHILKDEIIELIDSQSKHKYQGKLRRVAIWDDENKQVTVINNQVSWTANTISELNKRQWPVEIFFREINPATY